MTKKTFNEQLNTKTIRNLIVSVVSGILIVLACFWWIWAKHNYISNFDFYRHYNNILFAISMLGFWVCLFLWKIDFFKYLFVSMATVFLGFVFTYDKSKLDKKIYLENFSNTSKTIKINSKKYKIDPNSYKEIEFPKIDVKVGNKLIEHRGCYIVNLSYPKKYYKYGLVQNVSLNGIDFDMATMIGEIRDKVYQIDKNPNCNVSRVKNSFSKESFYIEGVDGD